MSNKSIVLGLALTAFAACALDAQDVALKNWPAPLYWQPSGAESQIAGRVSAEVRTPPPTAAAASSAALVFVAMTPCRVVDTRASQMFTAPFGAPSLTSGPARSFPIQSSTLCSVPSNAQAYSFNITLVPPGPVGYLILWPTGQAQPNTVILDDLQGQLVNNAAIVPAGTPNGSINAVVNATTDLVIDINGYYEPPSSLTIGQGTASAPSLNFSGDTGTGIFSSGTGTLNFTTGGTSALTVRADKDLDMAGNLRKGGVLFLHNLGNSNSTGVGLNALAVNTGSYNTASGSFALTNNALGDYNTANGASALFANTTGAFNTANGSSALSNNTTGNYNTANGTSALLSNTTGNYNTANGATALFSNTIGGENVAVGYQALYSDNGGYQNAAVGNLALYSNSSGYQNTALGYWAGRSITYGVGNIAIGYQSAFNISNGNYNITIGSAGESTDERVTRIGSAQTSFFAAGISGITTGKSDAMNVLIDSHGQLGTMNSSRRSKDDIQDMADASSGLMQLRPVTYRYRQPYSDGSKPLDYGLIAEEVAEVYPDLVVKNADGDIQTVQYHKLTPMLLNEVQKEHAALEQEHTALQQEHIALEQEHETVRSLQAQVAALRAALEKLLASVPPAE